MILNGSLSTADVREPYGENKQLFAIMPPSNALPDNAIHPIHNAPYKPKNPSDTFTDVVIPKSEIYGSPPSYSTNADEAMSKSNFNTKARSLLKRTFPKIKDPDTEIVQMRKSEYYKYFAKDGDGHYCDGVVAPAGGRAAFLQERLAAREEMRMEFARKYEVHRKTHREPWKERIKKGVQQS